MKVTRYTCRVQTEYLEGSTVRYTWPCGHQRKETLMIGPKGRGGKRLQRPMAPDMVRKMVKYWNGARGLHAESCRTCGRAALQSSGEHRD